MAAIREVTKALLSFGSTIDGSRLIPALSPEAGKLVFEDPFAFAFALGAALDRGVPAEVAWSYPLWIRERLGHLDPMRIAEMSLEEIGRILESCPRRPRYKRAAPRTVQGIARLVVREGGGDARKLWVGRRAEEVHELFMEVHGVGEGIASMVVALLDRVFGVPFGDLDHRAMDVKADVHVVRVLLRLGLLKHEASDGAHEPCQAASEVGSTGAAVAVTRSMHPEYPALLDAPLWLIGRTWCSAVAPQCEACAVNSVCDKQAVASP